MAVNMAKTSKEEKAQEEQRRHMLTRAFDEEQWARYEAWRSSKLGDAVVRRVSIVLAFIVDSTNMYLDCQSNFVAIRSSSCHIGRQVSHQSLCWRSY
jgi:hypothetical protein